jgi:hypothetical protein
MAALGWLLVNDRTGPQVGPVLMLAAQPERLEATRLNPQILSGNFYEGIVGNGCKSKQVTSVCAKVSSLAFFLFAF